MTLSKTLPFGLLLRQLRKRAGMTQRDLGAALNYSDSFICSLEKAQRLPDLEAVMTRFIPALGLQDDPSNASRLIEQAAVARGEQLPESHLSSTTFQRPTRMVMQAELDEQPSPLPSSPTELIGRTGEVHKISNRLLGHGGRLLTLVGPPGIGKTQLALAVAAHVQSHYADGAVFVALAEITDPMFVASAILDAVGSNDTRPKLPNIKLIEALRRKSMLLVLDNCEQIPNAGPLVAELLSACAGVVVLATSRERLHLRAEQRYQVPPLAVEAAIELFSRRAAAVNVGFEGGEAVRPLIGAICERLDCLPLALELCAGQTELRSLPQLLTQLRERRLDLLVGGAHDLPAQQRTLRRAIQRSYTLLAAEESRLFRSLGVFAGGFSLEMMDEASPSSHENGRQGEPAALHATLHALIGKSLVHVDTTARGEQRFRLLETLREFALEQLRAQGEEAEMRQRHYQACLHFFRAGDAYLRGAESTSWVALLEAEQDNLRAALQWTLAEAHYAELAWLLLAVHHFWHLNGHDYEAGRWLVQLLPHRQTLAVDLRLATLIHLVAAIEDLQEFLAVEPYLAEIFELLEICPYKQLHANAWYFSAWIAPDSAHTAAALARAVALLGEIGEGPALGPEFCSLTDDDFEVAHMQGGYGAFLIDEGEVAQAARLITDCLQRFRRRGNQFHTGQCRALLGHLALLRGDIAEATTCFQEAVSIGLTHRLPVLLVEWQPYLGLITLYNGNAGEARRLLEESLQRCLDVKNTVILAKVCVHLAELSLWEENVDEAAQWLGQSLAYYATPKRINISELQRFFVAAYLAMLYGQFRRAATLLGFIEVAHRRIHYVYAGPMLPRVNAALAKAREALGIAAFDELFAAGQQLSLEQAYHTLLFPGKLTT